MDDVLFAKSQNLRSGERAFAGIHCLELIISNFPSANLKVTI